MNATPTGTDAQQADSSTATVDTSATLRSMDRDERREFFRTGELSPPDASAESSPAPAVDQPGSTEPSPDAASEPAKPTPQRPAKNLKTRSAEIDAENAELQRKLEIRRTLREELSALDRRPDATRAASSPAPPTKEEWQRYQEMPNAPRPEDFEGERSYEDYTAAMGVFVGRQLIQDERRVSQQQQQYAQRERDITQIAMTARDRIQQARAADPEYVTKVNPDLLEIPTVFALPPHVAIGPHHVLATEMARSPAIAKLMIHFSTPEGQQEWIRLCGLSSTELLRGFGRIEARFDAPATSPASPVTQAPTPRAPLGRRAADPAGDSADHAVKSGDFRAYREAENRHEIDARR